MKNNIIEPLRSCPFCFGNNLKIATKVINDIAWKHVKCKDCNSYSKSIPKGYPNFDKVLTEKWNRRAYKGNE